MTDNTQAAFGVGSIILTIIGLYAALCCFAAREQRACQMDRFPPYAIGRPTGIVEWEPWPEENGLPNFRGPLNSPIGRDARTGAD